MCDFKKQANSHSLLLYKMSCKNSCPKIPFCMHTTLYSSNKELPFQIFQQKLIASCSV